MDRSHGKPLDDVLEPIDLARTPAMNLLDGTQKENDLYDWCRKMERLIPGVKQEESLL